MPGYNSNPQSVGSQKGIPATVRAAETPSSGSGGASASQAVALPEVTYDGKHPFSVQTKFAAAPGVFQDEIQVSDVDVDTSYQTILVGGVVTVDDTDPINFTYRAEFPMNLGKFVRVLCRTQNANAVAQTTTVKPS